MSEKIFIISGNMNEFVHWRKTNASSPRNWSDIIYVSGPEILKGYQTPHGRFIGTWYLRPDLDGIIIQLSVAGSLTLEHRTKLESIKSQYVNERNP